jgi:molybdate transport system substrate-binding protein
MSLANSSGSATTPRRHWLRRLGALAALTIATSGFAAPPRTTPSGDVPITVFAAASLKESLDEAASSYHKASGQSVRVSYAASSALARQIEQGAPADVFLSADRDWMDYLQQRSLIDTASRRDLLGNTLVLVAPKASTAGPVVLKRGTDLSPLLGGGRIAVALTASVPAGKYAKAAFESLGMWAALQPRAAEAENVRAALMLVARGETPLGVVYGSDARAEPGVRVLATFPADTHPPIVYPVARLRSSTHRQASAFVQWLRTPAAAAIFRKHGFTVL